MTQIFDDEKENKLKFSLFDGGASKIAPKLSKQVKELGVIGWLIVMVLVVITICLFMLLFLMWRFETEGKKNTSLAQGEVPITGAFAQGKPKPNDVLFRLAGSKREGATLFPELAAAFLRKQGFTSVNIKKSENLITIKGKIQNQNMKILISLGSPSGAFTAMDQNRVEAAISNRPIDSGEADRLSAFGDMQSAQNEKIIAQDVGYIVVNPANKIAKLSRENLTRILTGDITEWSQIDPDMKGKIDIKIEDTLDKNPFNLSSFLGQRDLVDTAKKLSRASDVYSAVAADIGALGIAFRAGNLNVTKIITLSDAYVGEFPPNEFNIDTESYFLALRVYFYLGSTANNSYLQEFSQFLSSKEAQAEIRKFGYNDLEIKPVNFTPPNNAPQDYKTLAKSSQRMNFDLRFRALANELDSKSIADISLFSDYVRKANISSKRIAIMAFADNSGSRTTNIGLAQSRAEAVVNRLSQYDINPGLVRALGEIMPVASNSFADGRAKNRRVEVWICPPPACPALSFSQEAPSQIEAEGSSGPPIGVHLGAPRRNSIGQERPNG